MISASKPLGFLLLYCPVLVFVDIFSIDVVTTLIAWSFFAGFKNAQKCRNIGQLNFSVEVFLVI